MHLPKVWSTVVVAFMLLTGMTSAVAAQDDAATMEAFDGPAGLETWYARSFGADFSVLVDSATPDVLPTGWFLLSTNVLQFESEEDAANGVVELTEQFEAEMGATDGAELQPVELDLELEHVAMEAQQQEGAYTTRLVEVVAQDGDLVYAVIGITLGDDPAPLAAWTVQAMQDAEVGDGEEVFRDDGSSEGGLWSKLPSAEAMAGEEPSLTLGGDGQFYPVPEMEATPAA